MVGVRSYYVDLGNFAVLVAADAFATVPVLGILMPNERQKTVRGPGTINQ
jgi:hypothetical protein